MDGFKRPKRPAQPQQVSPAPVRPATYEQRLTNAVPQRPQIVAVPSVQPVPAKQYLPVAALVSSPLQVEQAVELPDITLDPPKPAPQKRHFIRTIFLGFLAVVVLAGGITVLWYQDALKPVNSNDAAGKDVTIKKGDTLSVIAADLQQKGLIKNQYAFQVYARLSKQTNIPEGTCVIKASESVSEIITKMESGCHDFKSITFYPGATIEKPLYKPAGTIGDLDTMYIKYRLSSAGYSDQQIQQALSKQYAGPLFADKPAGTGLEGYIYGETYHVNPTASADTVLQMTFDQMYKDMTTNDLIAKFKAQGLNLYQGITLSSIVQRELNCEGKPTEERKQRCYGYQQTIAQVFLKRLKDGGTLGSDVTFIYAADMKGVAPTPDLDSLYNTRIHPGLPPGPIASPGLLAMKAVANPTDTNYNYFIAGDDGLIYFAKTLQEHESNIARYCKLLCNGL